MEESSLVRDKIYIYIYSTNSIPKTKGKKSHKKGERLGTHKGPNERYYTSTKNCPYTTELAVSKVGKRAYGEPTR